MTQDIRIAHHGASGAQATTRRTALEDKDQASGFGIPAMALLFIGFAVYLKNFFTASQAEDTGAAQDQSAPEGGTPTETASLPAAVDPDFATLPETSVRSDRNSGFSTDPQEAAAVLPSLVVLGLALESAKGEALATSGNSFAGGIAPDASLSGPMGGTMAGREQNGAMDSVSGGDRSSGGSNAAPGKLAADPVGNDTETSSDGLDASDPTTPDVPQIYDIAALFRDLGTTMQVRPDSLVDRVTDLAIGDLMRDLTLDEFRAHMGSVPQVTGRPLERLVSVLSDESSREAFLSRTGLAQDEALDASYTDSFDTSHSTTGTELDTGSDLFL